MAQLASVLAWGASGRPFESDHPDPFLTQSAFLQLVALLFFIVAVKKILKTTNFSISGNVDGLQKQPFIKQTNIILMIK